MKTHYCACCRHWEYLADGTYCNYCRTFFYQHSRLPVATDPTEPPTTIERLWSQIDSLK